ncbi:MAG: PulJ/GspJ family protein, partial [Romboutsia sp.]|uniref:PulJ/GspJ family protein n=1 Tax=Romboutsia sp. TaxID=1965302 RepID=UPI003F3BF5DE
MNRLNKNNGFTLLELLVSLAIVGLILLGFFRVMDSTQRINTKNDRDIKALNILQSEIENL